MTEIRVETTIERDGELHLRQLPCRKGDRVSAIVSIPTQSDDGERQAARRRFLELAKASTFNSAVSYPTRDELHGRN
ncbi:MAG: hypothetical protein SGI77_12445 [Pirellulaceae bacterium]|nr:hypothetical protein [Pirellulaceae bacterium]